MAEEEEKHMEADAARSGGVDVSAADNLAVSGDIAGRDKIIQNIYIYLGIPPEESPLEPRQFSNSQRRRLQQRLEELEAPLVTYGRRIQALTSDIAMSLDSEKRVVLKERLGQVKQERQNIEIEIEEVERLLAAAARKDSGQN